jgi:hypothetical protein
MKAHKGFTAYTPKPDEFKIAQSRTYPPITEYKPKPHPYAQRMIEEKKVPSLWTPTRWEE